MAMFPPVMHSAKIDPTVMVSGATSSQCECFMFFYSGCFKDLGFLWVVCSLLIERFRYLKRRTFRQYSHEIFMGRRMDGKLEDADGAGSDVIERRRLRCEWGRHRSDWEGERARYRVTHLLAD